VINHNVDVISNSDSTTSNVNREDTDLTCDMSRMLLRMSADVGTWWTNCSRTLQQLCRSDVHNRPLRTTQSSTHHKCWTLIGWKQVMWLATETQLWCVIGHIFYCNQFNPAIPIYSFYQWGKKKLCVPFHIQFSPISNWSKTDERLLKKVKMRLKE